MFVEKAIILLGIVVRPFFLFRPRLQDYPIIFNFRGTPFSCALEIECNTFSTINFSCGLFMNVFMLCCILGNAG